MAGCFLNANKPTTFGPSLWDPRSPPDSCLKRTRFFFQDLKRDSGQKAQTMLAELPKAGSGAALVFRPQAGFS